MHKNLTVAFLGVVSAIAIILMISINQYQTTIDTLSKENKQLMQQQQSLESKISYTKVNSTKKETEDYADWNEIEEISNQFYEDSSGKFKKSWGIYLANEARKYEIDPYILYELLKVETGNTFDPTLVGPETKYGHAYGMAQFMKNTAPWIADMADLPYEDELLFDPYYSMKLSVVYLDYLHHEYSNWNEALTAYHRGMSGMEAYKKLNGSAKSEYAMLIQSNADSHRTVAFANELE